MDPFDNYYRPIQIKASKKPPRSYWLPYKKCEGTRRDELLEIAKKVDDKIAAITKEKTEAAMQKVVADPEGSTFSDSLELTEEMTAAAESFGATLTEAYAVEAGGAAAGCALKIEEIGRAHV